MTQSSLVNLVRVLTSTTGTGTITLGAAALGYAGTSFLTNGSTYSYSIVADGANWECGQGVYTASGQTLTRSVTSSSNGGSPISLSGNAFVNFTALAADIPQPPTFGKVTITQPATGATLTIADGKTLTASNSITLAGVDGKTLTINKNITLDGVDGKTLTLSNSIGLAGTDGKTLTVNNNLTLAGTDGTTMTFPAANDTLAGLGTAQNFTAVQTFTANAVASPGALTWAPIPSVAGGTTNGAGALFTQNLSQSTGTGAGGAYALQGSFPGASSGSTQNALAILLKVNPVSGGTNIQGSTIGGTQLLQIGSAGGNTGISVTNVIIGLAAGSVPGLAAGNDGSGNPFAAVPANGKLGFLSGNSLSNAVDTMMTRKAAASLQFGAPDAASPVAQTVGFQSVVGGTTNGAGANAVINLSRGTGTGIAGNLTINGAPHGTTGSTQNAYQAALTINGDTLLTTLGGGVQNSNLPTADPHVVGRWWANAGVVTVSAG